MWSGGGRVSLMKGSARVFVTVPFPVVAVPGVRNSRLIKVSLLLISRLTSSTLRRSDTSARMKQYWPAGLSAVSSPVMRAAARSERPTK